MHVIEATFASMILFSILATIGVFFLIGNYSVLRMLKIPVDRVVWIVGAGMIVGSIAFSFAVLMPDHFGAAHHFSSLLGGLSFLVAVYSASQWVMRRYYIHIKKHTSSLLMKGAKNFLLFLRKHHPFLGWIVSLTAIAHVIYYMPLLSRLSVYAVISGFAALGVLLSSVLSGEWLWFQSSIKKRGVPRLMRTLHSTLSAAFLVILVGSHFGAWILDKTPHH